MAKSKKIDNEAKNAPRGYDDTFELTTEQIEELASQIRSDILEGDDEKNLWLEERVKDVNAYFGIKKQTDWPFKGAAKISSKVHQIMVDTTAANLVSSAIAPENILSAQTSKAQSAENAKYVTDLHNRLARYEYHLQEVLDRSWHTGLIESFTVLKPVYVNDIRETVATVKRWLPKGYAQEDINYDLDTDTVFGKNGEVIPSLDIERMPEDPKELEALDMHECTLEVTKEHRQEGVRVLVVNGADIHYPSSSPGETPYEKCQRAPYIYHQEYKTLQEMELLEDQGTIKNVPMLKGMIENITEKALKDISKKEAGMYDIDNTDRHLTRNVWWYGKFKYRGKLRELVVYFNTETSVVLKIQVNQFGIRPFFPQVPLPIEGTTGGESLPKRLRSLVTELELIMNTLINMGLIKAYPPKFFDPTGGFDPKTLGNIGPNSYVPVRDPSRNIFMPPQPEDPRILMEMAKFLMDLIERSAANSDAVQGQTSPTANTTAFEVQQALVRAGVRFDIIYRRLKSQLAPMFEYIQMLTLRFMPLEKELELMGERGQVQGPDGQPMSRLQAIFKEEGMHGLVITGNSLMEEQVEAQKAEKLFTLMSQDPYLSYGPEAPYYLRYNLIKSLSPLFQDKLLKRPEEVAKLLRDRQQVQNEQEQKAVEDGKNHSDPTAQMQAQAMQMELQMKQAQMQLDMQKQQADIQLSVEQKQADMKMKEQEHDQKMRQLEEAHKLKLELMKEDQRAKAKAKPNKES